MGQSRKYLLLAILILLPLAILFYSIVAFLRLSSVAGIAFLVSGLILSAGLWIFVFPSVSQEFRGNKPKYISGTLNEQLNRELEANELEQHLTEALLLNRVIGTVSSTLEPQDICETVCKELALTLRVPQASLALLDQTQNAFITSAEYREASRPSVLGDFIPADGNPVTEFVVKERLPLVIDNVPTDSRLDLVRDLMKRRGTISTMIVPLFIRDQLIGIMGLDAVEARRFTQGEALLAQKVASSVGQVIEIARLYDNLRLELDYRQIVEDDLDRRERYLAALVEIQTLLLNEMDEDKIFGLILRKLGEAALASWTFLFQNSTDDQGKLFASMAYEWVSEGYSFVLPREQFQHFSWEGYPRWLSILQSGSPLTGDVTDFPEEERQFFSTEDIHSVLILPVHVNGDFWGFLGFINCGECREWSPAEIEMIKASAAAISIAEERHLVERELAQQRDFALQVMNNMGQGLMVTDLEGKFTFVNPALATMLGVSPEDLTGKTSAELGLPDDLGAITEANLEGVEAKPGTYEIRFQRSSGTYIDTLISDVPTHVDGHISGSIAVLTDVTERKTVETTLRKNEEFMRGLYNITSTQDLYYTDKILALLVLGTQHFGMEGAALIRVDGDLYRVIEMYSTYTEITLDQDMITRQTYFLDAVKAGEPIAFENAGQTDWAYHPAYLDSGVEAYLCTPVFTNGQVYGVVSFFSYSPRKAQFSPSEKEFIRLMAQWVGGELEREQYVDQLQKYTEEIARKNQALSEARDQALEASRLKSEFLATMSHEIRTPMNAVIGMAELVLDTQLTRDQREYTTIIQDSAQVLLMLINDILDFSKIEAGKLQIESIELELLSVVEGATEMFISKARDKKLSLMSYVAPQIPRVVMGDGIRLRQILINLIGNAIKFTERGEIIVRAELESETSDRSRVHFQVQDTGIGLSSVARRRLFTPFTQADGSTTRKYGGTGLGLAISKRLVELMGGEIGVESVEGEGSTFWFTIPFEKAPSQLAPTTVTPTITLKDLRILMVDDNKSHLDIMNRYLRAWGMRWAQTTHPEEVETLLTDSEKEGDPFQIAILDMEMPEINGLDLARAIRSRQHGPQIRLILLTAFDQRDTGEAALQAGFAAYLTKPVKQAHLLETIQRVVQGETIKEEEPALSADGIWPVMDAPVEPAVEIATKEKIREEGKGLILLAEDNAANQRLAIVQLEKLGYKTEAVMTGDKAVTAVLKSPLRYKMVLMDCQMPELDGFAATRLIREAEEKSGFHIPIIAMTANAMQGDREVCEAAGMDDYMSKPIKLNNLRQVVEKWSGFIQAQTLQMPAGMVENPSSHYLDPEIISGIRELQADGEPDFLTELIDLYLKDSQLLLERIRVGIDGGNSDEVRRASHTLKGTSGNLGARILSSYCSELESLAAKKELDQAPQWLTRLETEYAAASKALKAERKEEPQV